jgi:hypothetical protein
MYLSEEKFLHTKVSGYHRELGMQNPTIYVEGTLSDYDCLH